MLHRLRLLAGRIGAGVSGLYRHRLTPVYAGGTAAGVAGWSAVHPFILSYGFNRESVAALLLAGSICLAAGARLGTRNPAVNRFGLPALLAAAWLVLTPAILSVTNAFFAAVSVDRLESLSVRLCLLFAAAAALIGPSCGCLGLAAAGLRERRAGVPFLAAAGFGIALSGVLLGPYIGLQGPLLAVVVTIAVHWFVRLIRPTSFAATDRADRTASNPAVVASAALVAVVAGAGGRVIAQLTPEAAYLIASGGAAFLAGTAAGLFASGRLAATTGSHQTARRVGALASTFASAVPLAAFPWFVERTLDANAFVSSVFWLTTIRVATVAGLFGTLGCGFGLLGGGTNRFGAVVVSAAVGLSVSGWLMPAVGVVPLLLGSAAGLMLLNLGSPLSLIPAGRRGRAATAACAVALAALWLNVGRYTPARSARLLFNTEVFISHQRGVPTDLLPHLDDTRLVSVDERAFGTVTTWKQGGDLLVTRINGVPVGATSVHPERCPLPTPDVLRVVLPLTLHESPETLLVLGDPAGLATALASGFPLRDIIRYESAGGNFHDSRITASSVEPRLAVASERRLFDVIVSDPGSPSLVSSAPELTRQFYAAAAARLVRTGIFCQRLRYADFGAEPLRVLAATTNGLFGDRMILEVGSGEYVFLAAGRDGTLLRDGLVSRLQRPQVRRALAALGWDWCVPLNLASVAEDGLKTLAADAADANTAFNARWAYALPPEVMRWGQKSQEIQQATAAVTTRLLARGVPEADRRDVLDRVAEVTGQHRLMTEYPDQPWAYRKEVRTRLKETPRSVIRPVGGEVERVMHPDDRRRLDYFAALGEAAKSPDLNSLAALERFANPYDPLVSYFLHHEAAPLYARLGRLGQDAELAHRLHASRFGDPRDRSVRNEIAAVELLVKNPRLVPDDAERFDQLNGLVEQLLARWEARGLAQPKSPEVVMIDIEKTLGATAAAVAAMAPLSTSAGLTESQWELRQAAIERTLTRPLRSYRTGLLPHVRSAKRQTAGQAREAAIAPTPQTVR